jgi:hypothetical protein
LCVIKHYGKVKTSSCFFSANRLTKTFLEVKQKRNTNGVSIATAAIRRKKAQFVRFAGSVSLKNAVMLILYKQANEYGHTSSQQLPVFARVPHMAALTVLGRRCYVLVGGE